MKVLYTVLVLGLLSFSAYAQDTCTAQSQAKNLHGAAETSFLNRCRADCTKMADERKIYGAARNSFVARCQS